MVSKEILIQYDDILKELQEIAERKRKLEKELQSLLDGGTVTDMVTGGAGGIQHFKIEGFPQVQYDRARIALKANVQKLEMKSTELIELKNEIEEYISGINDSRMRRIVTKRFVEKKTWNQVADDMGGMNTDESVKKAFYRFLEES